MDSISKLRKALKQGYLLHGSPHILSELEPQQAHDDETEEGNQVAVYATKNLPIAVFKGLLHGKGNSYRTGWTWSDSEKRLFGKNVELANGYVYILDPATFQPSAEDADESFSLVRVVPLEKVEVIPDDLLSLQQQQNIIIDIR